MRSALLGDIRTQSGSSLLARGIVHEFAKLLRAATGDRDLSLPFDGIFTGRQLEPRESALEPAVRLSSRRHRSVARHHHRLDQLVTSAAYHKSASPLGFTDDRTGCGGYLGPLLIRYNHDLPRQ